MDAIILAGGVGSRIKSLSNGVPKPMIVVSGRPFIEWQIMYLIKYGVSRIIISTGYKSFIFEDYFKNKRNNVEIIIALESTPLGTGGGVINAAKHVLSENVLVLNGDSLCIFDVCKLIKLHNNYKADLTLVSKYCDDNSRYGMFSLDGDIVKKFDEKNDQSTGGYISVGFYCMNIKILREKLETNNSFEYDLMPKWINEKKKIYSLRVDEEFIDIGTPESLKQAEQFIKSHSTSL